jgi:hypothetical protein
MLFNDGKEEYRYVAGRIRSLQNNTFDKAIERQNQVISDNDRVETWERV